jgi:hypothetical protein
LSISIHLSPSYTWISFFFGHNLNQPCFEKELRSSDPIPADRHEAKAKAKAKYKNNNISPPEYVAWGCQAASQGFTFRVSQPTTLF